LNKGWFHTDITEDAKKLAHEVINSNSLTNGQSTKTLESEIKNIFGVKTAIYTNSGTSALAMSLLASGIGQGDIVGTSGIGWIATVQAVKFTGADVLLLDVENELPTLDINIIPKVADKITALIPVNYNGRQVNIKEVKKLIPNKKIIEDSCKSFFSKDFDAKNYSGTNGDYGCFSLGMISMLPGIYGGFVVTNKSEDQEILSCLKWHGTTYKNNNEKYERFSYNFKTSNLHASFALGMLETYQERIEKLSLIYEMYKDGLEGLENNKLLPVNKKRGEIPLLIDVVSKDRNQVTKLLNSNDIPTCNYHESLDKASYTNKFQELKNSSKFGSMVFHPPCGPDQDLERIEKSIKILKNLG
tara:strand:- start:12723 stop:13796 length:1074 start_codon:yes stop_codon:yes gene_type:complete